MDFTNWYGYMIIMLSHFQITCRGSHLRGQVIMKIRPHVADEYRFESSMKQSVIERNIALSRELKKDFSFLYKASTLQFTCLLADMYTSETQRGRQQNYLWCQNHPERHQCHLVPRQERRGGGVP